ncbi:MAG TPA: isochorismatase family protein, partial [Thermomicrobiales bacterium]|nr:isochorismatase family protein [Thermomicrobiales bacterium]
EPYASPALTFSKPGDAGIPDELADFLQNERIEQVTIAGIDTDMCVLKVAMDIFDLGIKPIILTDCCASTHGLQSHLAGLAVLARNVGADQLHDAGLNGGTLAAPSPD